MCYTSYAIGLNRCFLVHTFTGFSTMAKEPGPKNIRVNSLCPGMIATSFHDRFTKDQVRTNVAAGKPLHREGDAREVADTVAYLLSDESTFITGNIDINGGAVLLTACMPVFEF